MTAFAAAMAAWAASMGSVVWLEDGLEVWVVGVRADLLRVLEDSARWVGGLEPL